MRQQEEESVEQEKHVVIINVNSSAWKIPVACEMQKQPGQYRPGGIGYKEK